MWLGEVALNLFLCILEYIIYTSEYIYTYFRIYNILYIFQNYIGAFHTWLC